MVRTPDEKIVAEVEAGMDENDDRDDRADEDDDLGPRSTASRHPLGNTKWWCREKSY